MIQRIQTIYLLVIAAMMALMLTLPLATFTLAGTAADPSITPEQIEFSAFGVSSSDGENVKATIYTGILGSIIAIMALVTVVLYKRRTLQIRLCAMMMVFLVAVMGYMVYYHFSLNSLISQMGDYTDKISFINAAPLIALVCARMAMRAILSDEYLVRSADRIR